MDFVGLGCDRICEVSYKLIGHLIYDLAYEIMTIPGPPVPPPTQFGAT